MIFLLLKNISWLQKFRNLLFLYAVLGFLSMSLPGLSMGYWSTRTVGQAAFWVGVLATLTTVFLSLFLFVGKGLRELPLPPSGQLAFKRIAALIAGIGFAWIFWLGLGKAQLYFVKKEIVQAGFSFDPPPNPPSLPDERNGVYYLQELDTQPDNQKGHENPEKVGSLRLRDAQHQQGGFHGPLQSIPNRPIPQISKRGARVTFWCSTTFGVPVSRRKPEFPGAFHRSSYLRPGSEDPTGPFRAGLYLPARNRGRATRL